MIVLDTNVVSELMRPMPAPAVERWISGQPAAQIAAIAASRGAIVATRNIMDFQNCGIGLIDPWSAGA